MANDLSTDHFDCPHCGIKRVTYEKVSSASETLTYKQPEESDHEWISYLWMHYVVKCNREVCRRMTYLKVCEKYMLPPGRWMDLETRTVEIQYPSNNSSLPDYVPADIRKHYKEAVDAFNFGLHSSASVMCRKVIYEICDKQKVSGVDYKDKIKNLGFDKRITDPILNIKNIGDETVHAKGWDRETIQKAMDVLAIIIDMIYTQENRIKEFSKHYSKTNQTRVTDNKNRSSDQSTDEISLLT
jgi:hypothetical protein